MALAVLGCSWAVQVQGEPCAVQQLLHASEDSPVELISNSTSPLSIIISTELAQEAASQAFIRCLSSARTVEVSLREPDGTYSYLTTCRGQQYGSTANPGQSASQQSANCFLTLIPLPTQRSTVLQLKLLSLVGNKKACLLMALACDSQSVQQCPGDSNEHTKAAGGVDTPAGEDERHERTAAAVGDEPVLSQAGQMRLLLKHALQAGDASSLPASLQMLATKMAGVGDAGNPGGSILASVATSVARSALSKDEMSSAQGTQSNVPLSTDGTQDVTHAGRIGQADLGGLSALGQLGQLGGMDRIIRVMDRLETHMSSMDMMMGRIVGIEAGMQQVLAGMARMEQRLAALELHASSKAACV